MNKPHKHAHLMLQFAQDAQETETPWERWECKYPLRAWEPMGLGAYFHSGIEYRRKPRVIVINGIEVPEPMREKPEIGTTYFTFAISNGKPWILEDTFDNSKVDIERFSAGICHSTREAAELHAKALLSFTKKEEAK